LIEENYMGKNKKGQWGFTELYREDWQNVVGRGSETTDLPAALTQEGGERPTSA